jgi:excinuclease ABC subunit A
MSARDPDDLHPRAAPHPGGAAQLHIRGARTHNLKNIDLDIPKHALVVITGLSGSGKSSLAFDTLYAEGQRRYVESLSAYARQFLQLMDKPDVDVIEGLSPAISIEQKATSHNPRSTVGTVTEIHDYLRLLYARAGTPFCPDHDLALQAQSVGQMVDAVLALPEDTKLMVLAPVVRDRKGEFSELFADMQARGYVRFRIDGKTVEAADLPELKKNEKHDIDVVIDRLKARPDAKQRLAESFEAALRIADGKALALEMDSGTEHLFSSKFACPVCSYALPELEPRLFSFNAPMGACPHCDGLGQQTVFDPERVVAFPSLSLAGGAVKGWDRRNGYTHSLLESVARHYGFDIDTPFEDLPAEVQRVLLYGSGEVEIAFVYEAETAKGKTRSVKRSHPFEGIIPNFERRFRETDSAAVREDLARYQAAKPCAHCGGTRLKREARHVFLVGADGSVPRQAIYQVEHATLADSLRYFERLQLSGAKAEIADKVVREIRARLKFLNDVGLNYLSLDRSADTLSGGEAQRIRLASQIGSGLTGVMYVLDEPSIGLHQRDNERLIGTLRHLRDLGNSVLVVEHDEDMIRAADHVIDMGPGAGVHGGRVIAQGTPDEVAADPDSLTGRYLAGALRIEVPQQRRAWQAAVPDVPAPEPARARRAGHAAAGLARHPAARAAQPAHRQRARQQPEERDRRGAGGPADLRDRRVRLGQEHADQRHALHRGGEEAVPRPCRAGAARRDRGPGRLRQGDQRRPEPDRPHAAQQPGHLHRAVHADPRAVRRGADGARARLRRGALQLQRRPGGRRRALRGLPGRRRAEGRDALPARRLRALRHLRRPALQPRDAGGAVQGPQHPEVLGMTVEEARRFFDAVPALARKLQTLLDVGLGYITLGQSATTLSGGEAQRVKLALELSKRDTGRTLYILDEPTTGLHFADIELLLRVLHQLRDAGNTIVVIEHNLDVIKTADWLIDMGPEGGAGGGRVLVAGTPEDVAACAESFTGRFLKPLLALPAMPRA